MTDDYQPPEDDPIGTDDDIARLKEEQLRNEGNDNYVEVWGCRLYFCNNATTKFYYTWPLARPITTIRGETYFIRED